MVVSGANPVLELLRARVPMSRLVIGPGPRRAEVLAECDRAGVAHEEGTAWHSTGWRVLGHQGVVAIVPPFDYASLEEVCAAPGDLALVLDGIQDPRNLGAILRTARAAGVGGVVLPQDRSAGVTGVVVSASAGTLFGLRVARVPNLVRAMGLCATPAIGWSASSRTRRRVYTTSICRPGSP